MDNSKFFFPISQQKLDETVLMMGHKICFYGEIRLIISKSSLLPLLIWSTEIIMTYALNKTVQNIHVDEKSVIRNRHSPFSHPAETQIGHNTINNKGGVQNYSRNKRLALSWQRGKWALWL